MLIFESQWRQLVNEVSLNNLERSQDDPHFGAGLPQLMGDPPNNTLQLQAKLHPLVLQQGKELTFPAMQHVLDIGTYCHSWMVIK